MAFEEADLGFPPKWRRRSASLTLFPSFIMDNFSKRTLSYDKLPHHPLRLTIRKLDGSSFDIDVLDGATVAQLKEAVEYFFSVLPRTGPDKISWYVCRGEKISSKKHVANKQQKMALLTSNANDVKIKNDELRIDIEKLHYEAADSFIEESECTMPPCFMSWFSYSRLATKEIMQTEEKGQTFSFTNNLRQLVGISNNKPAYLKWNLD